MNPVRRPLQLLAILLFSVLSTGCRALYAQGAGMREVPPLARIQADPESAVLVFVRPSLFGYGLAPTIIDETGARLGQSSAESYFVVRVAPGSHVFTAFCEEQGVLRADLEKGRIYMVEVSIIFRLNESGIGRPDLRPVRAKTSRWNELAAQLPTMHRFEAIPTPPVEPSAAVRAAREEQRLSSLRALQALDKAALAEHTLLATDGL